MKNKISIIISKDTPAETLAELYSALKADKEKPKRKQPLYALNEDIEKLHARYEELYKQVKNSLNLSEKQIEQECETLSLKYEFELAELSKLRKVDYDKRQAEIKAREKEQTPWRRCWLWRLLFQPVTNRAQDIIEKRAELEADIEHTAAEKVLENERKQLTPESDKKPCKRESERKTRDELEEAIRQADSAEINEAIAEPQAEVRQSAEPAPGVLPTQARRPRPPASCRKPRTGQ